MSEGESEELLGIPTPRQAPDLQIRSVADGRSKPATVASTSAPRGDSQLAHPAEWSWSRPYGDGSDLAGTFKEKWADVPAPRPLPLIETAERWQAVPCAPGYEVSTFGNARSVEREIVNSLGVTRRYAGQELKQWWDDAGYPHVTLGRGNHNVILPRILVLTFRGVPFFKKAVVRHIDGDPRNNKIDNLIWGTYQDNIEDTMRHGRHWTFHVENCPLGHPLAGVNLVPSKLVKGFRECRACNAGRAAIFYLRSKGVEAPTLQEVADSKYAKFMRQARAAPP